MLKGDATGKKSSGSEQADTEQSAFPAHRYCRVSPECNGEVFLTEVTTAGRKKERNISAH